jgi:hypothetical protein
MIELVQIKKTKTKRTLPTMLMSGKLPIFMLMKNSHLPVLCFK